MTTRRWAGQMQAVAAAPRRERHRRRLGWIADYLRVSVDTTSKPATVALRLVRPLCTLAAVVGAMMSGLPWWGSLAVALVTFLVRPLHRWWLDVALAVGVGAAGLWLVGAALLLRTLVTGWVVLRWGTGAAVAAPRRELLSSTAGSTDDGRYDPDVAWNRYVASIRSDDDFGDAATEYLLAAWTTGNALTLARAAAKVLRIEVFNVMPTPVSWPSMGRRLFRLMVLERVAHLAPRIVTVLVGGVTAWYTVPEGNLLTSPIRLVDAWAAAAGVAVLAWLTVRARPAVKSALVLGVVMLAWLRAAILPALAVVVVGIAAGWAMRQALARWALNAAPRLSWVGRRVTGLRQHAMFQAASALDAAGRFGIAIDVLTEIAAAANRTRPTATAVALAHMALIEQDRGNLQRAVEHAESARGLAGRVRVRTARAVALYAFGLSRFAVGDYPAAEEALAEAEPVLRRRPEGSTCTAVLAQVCAALDRPEKALEWAARTARTVTAGQLPSLVESQLAAGWARLRAGGADEARRFLDEMVRNIEHLPVTIEADTDERTQNRWRRLMGEARLLLGRLHLALGDPVAAATSLDHAARHLRGAAADDLLGMTFIYQGQCHRLRYEWADARAKVKVGIDKLEARRGQLKAGLQRASAVRAGTDHYDTALAVLVDAQHQGDATAGTVAAGLVESLRRNALANALRNERSTFVDHLPTEAIQAMEDLDRVESTMDNTGSRDGEDSARSTGVLMRTLETAVSRGFADAYRAENIDYLKLSAIAQQAHILQFEFLEVKSDHWRGYRIWVPPYGRPWADEITVTDTSTLKLLDALRRGERTAPLATEFDQTADVWAGLARTLLPTGMLTELRLHPATDPIRLLIVPGEHLAYLPWAPLLLDSTDSDSILLHKAVIQVVPSLNLLQPSRVATRDGRTLAYLDLETRNEIEHGGVIATAWQRLSSLLPLIPVGSRDEFEQFLSDPRIDCIYISAHGEGSSFNQRIKFSSDRSLSAAAALLFRWPRSLVFASCFVANVEQQTGHEPFGLAIACMLGGCRTFIGGVIKVERKATAQIATNVSIALAAGADPATALRDAQRAYIQREGAIFLTEWAGLICISTEWRSRA